MEPPLASIEDKSLTADDCIDHDYIKDCKIVFDDLMNAYPVNLGKATSKKERDEKKVIKDTNLVYGEIPFTTVAEAFEKIIRFYGRPNKFHSGPDGILQSRGGNFYDLGSGTGKIVFSAAILHNFDFCCGIELLEGLYSVSLDALNTFNNRGKAHFHLSDRQYETHCQFIQGDITNMKTKDWRDGDIVFANCTCYDDKMMEKISNISLGMKRGSFFVSTTNRLINNDFVVLECDMKEMSWGEATLFIMQKTTDPKITEGEDESEEEN